jgi:hypothetical protein
MLEQPARPSSLSRLALTPSELLLVLACVLVCLAGARRLWPGSPQQAQTQPDIETQRRHASAMDRHLVVLRKRQTARGQIVRRLLAGELTLWQAAAWFDHLNKTPAEHPTVLVVVPGRSAEEKVCRQVLNWVQIAAQREPSRETEATLRRLSKELEEALARGPVVLPDFHPDEEGRTPDTGAR